MVWRPLATLVLLELAAVALAVVVPAPGGVTSQDWPAEMTGVSALQAGGLTGAGVRVAVLDTGLDETHPAFAGLRVVRRDAFLNPDAPTADADGHGTFVVGVLAAQGTPIADRLRGIHLRGVAPGIDLLVHRVLENQDEPMPAGSSIAARHVQRAVDAGADVVCLSLAFGNATWPFPPNVTAPLRAQIERAVSRGVLVVVAAGNANASEEYDDVVYPANLADVIAVAAVGPDGEAAAFSRRGNETNRETFAGQEARPLIDWKPEVAAPGVRILGPELGGGYGHFNGTSVAVPHVCGGLALLLEAHPHLRAWDDVKFIRDVKSRIITTAQRPGDGPLHDPASGFGIFRADRLVASYSAV